MRIGSMMPATACHRWGHSGLLQKAQSTRSQSTLQHSPSWTRLATVSSLQSLRPALLASAASGTSMMQSRSMSSSSSSCCCRAQRTLSSSTAMVSTTAPTISSLPAGVSRSRGCCLRVPLRVSAAATVPVPGSHNDGAFQGLNTISTTGRAKKPSHIAAVPAAADSNADHSGGYDYDVFVIGGGSGGVRTARTAAEHGAKVALVELPLAFISSADQGGLGGTCVLRGCVPKKLMLYASTFATELAAAKDFGWVDQSVGRLDWPSFIEAKQTELLRLSQAYRDNLIKAGVDLKEGHGKLLGPNTVEVDGQKFKVKNIVIATGGQSSRIPIPGAEHAISSDKVLELESIPKVVTLIGGGYIGMEFAGMFARLGCEVHVVVRQQLPLAPRFDEEVCRFFLEQCSTFSGIKMHMGSNPTAIIKEPDGSLTVRIERITKKPAAESAAHQQQQQSQGSRKDMGSDSIHNHNNSSNGSGGGSSGSSSKADSVPPSEELAASEQSEEAKEVFEIRGNEQVVLAVGRAAKTAGLGLEEAGVELGPKGSVKVDKFSRSNIPSIWAVGDVTSRVALTPVAIMEGAALGRSLATGQLEAPCYDAVPSACFSWPFVATVGLTEQQAVQQGLSCEVFTKIFTPLKATMASAHNAGSSGSSSSSRVEKGFLKLLVEAGSGKILGLHIVGEDAPEILQGFALAIKLGATKQQLDSLVGVHPTAAEELLGLEGPERTVTPQPPPPPPAAAAGSHHHDDCQADGVQPDKAADKLS